MRLIQILCGAALLFGVISSAAPARAQSFPCSRASTCTEHVICQSPQLARLDERMAQLYFQLQNQSSRRGGDALLASQVHWLRSRDSCSCNANCLLDHYDARIRLFESVLFGQ